MANITMHHLLVGADNIEIVDAVARNGIGAPAVASTVAEMTDTSKVYVYTGSESGYTAGNWYYYNGSAWVSGGVYNSTAFETDDTLTQEGKAADAKAVGDALADVTADLAEKANVDGAYENMTVGNAEQLVSTLYNTDKVPYLFRTSGGSTDIGNRENLKKIVGGSVAWNQLVRNANNAFTPNRGTKAFDPSTHTYTITHSADTAEQVGLYGAPNYFKISVSHCYLLRAKMNTGMVSTVVLGCGSDNKNKPNIDLTTKREVATISKATSTSVPVFYPVATGDVEISDINIFDLTQMFGSVIADYLYTLEQSQAGAGVAKLKSWGCLTEDYYEYDPGTMQSVEGLSSHDTVGFNAYDPNTGKAEVLGGNQYQITGTFTSLSLDGTTITPDSSGLFVPDHNGTLTVTGGGADTCVHLTWSGSRNGDYEPYVKHSYPLDPTVTLRGIPKLDENGNLYYDGDEYEPDGTVTRRYKELVLNGTETWSVYATGALQRTISDMAYVTTGYDQTLDIVKCDHLANVTRRVVAEGTGNGIAGNAMNNNPNIVIRDGDNTASVAAWQSYCAAQYAAGTPVKILYELATPTTEQADPYQETQIVDDFGTEEFVTSGIVPVGHVTEYMANLRDKLQHLPDLASADGDYAVRQTGSQMALVPLEQVKELPDAPTNDGTYTLIATVSNGTVTLSWRS